MTDKPLFTDLGLEQDLTDALGDRGIVHPFPIQELTLPLALKGHDIIGQARTGTGKTLGFGLPLIQNIDPERNETQAMVIVPTRELCIQVEDDLTVGKARGIRSIAVYGGVGYDEQIEALTTGVHIVVGTPGRTIDHLNRGNLDVSKIHTIVLDEADEMLDMGFLPDIERLLADVPTDRQTLLFSATMPTEIVKLARRFMDKPTFMRADETLNETAPEVDQHFFLVHRMDKPRVLARLLQMPDRGGAFVFCRTKRMCDRLVQELDTLGVKAIAVHGDLRQAARERNLDKFRDGSADVLVATEVAARGLDVDNVSHVVNYDCPDDEKMYLHRIGRTARAGSSGFAVTFAEFNEVDRINVIRKRLDAEAELVEVFSTSDELTALFDLPAATPWDDLSGSTGASSSRSSSNGRGQASGPSSRSRSKGNDSNRRSSNRRPSKASSDAARSERSSNRRDTSRNESGRDSASQGDTTRGDTARGDTTRSDSTSSEPARSRSRNRTRTRSTADSSATSSKQAATSERSSGSDRSRPRSDEPQQSTSSRGSDRGDTAAAATDNGTPSGGARPRSRRRASDGAESTPQEARTKSDSSGNGSSQRTSSRRSSSQARDNDGRSSGSSGDARDRTSASGSRTSRSSGRVRSARRGDEARGTGRPSPRRNVEVEHLP